MAQLFVDSFSIYATADIPTRWAGGNIGCSIVTSPLPPNSQAGAQTLLNSGGFLNQRYVLSNNYGALSRLILGARFMRASGASGTLFQAVSGGGLTPVCSVGVDNTGTYIFGANGFNNDHLLGTGPIIPQLEWHHYELDMTFGLGGTATINLYIDGSPTPFISAASVTTGAATATQYALGLVMGNSSSTFQANQNSCTGNYADHYAFSGTGAAPFNAPLATQGLGAAKMAFTMPAGPGVISNWTANGAATIWQSINQIPQDGDTTYASDATPGDQYQCTFSALPAIQTLISAQLSTYAREDDAGARAYQSGFWKGGTYGYSGVNQFLGGTYNYIQDEYMLNPVTGIAWAPADLTGLQFGAKLTV
jgi:hypothetical protein